MMMMPLVYLITMPSYAKYTYIPSAHSPYIFGLCRLTTLSFTLRLQSADLQTGPAPKTHGGRWSNRMYRVPALPCLLSTCVVFWSLRRSVVEYTPAKFSPRRILRSSRPQEIFQPPQQGFFKFSVHAQLQLLGNIFQLFTPHLTSP